MEEKSGRIGYHAPCNLDSAIEIFASVVVVWQLKGVDQGRESVSLKLVGAD